MKAFSYPKMGSFDRTFKFFGEENIMLCKELVNAELVGALVFGFIQLKTGGPKLLCAPLCFVTAKANSDFT
jgi:hypothetical protein